MNLVGFQLLFSLFTFRFSFPKPKLLIKIKKKMKKTLMVKTDSELEKERRHVRKRPEHRWERSINSARYVSQSFKPENARKIVRRKFGLNRASV